MKKTLDIKKLVLLNAVDRKGYTPITVFYPSESRGTVPMKR